MFKINFLPKLRIRALSFYPDEDGDDQLRVYVTFQPSGSETPLKAGATIVQQAPSGLIKFRKEGENWILITESINKPAVSLIDLLAIIGSDNQSVDVWFIKAINDAKNLYLVDLTLVK